VHNARYILTKSSGILKWNISTCENEVNDDQTIARGKNKMGAIGVDMGVAKRKASAL
jgi:hypothetical protein